MTGFVAVDLKRIQEQRRNFSWPRPPHCFRCRNWQVWGPFEQQYAIGITGTRLTRLSEDDRLRILFLIEALSNADTVVSAIKDFFRGQRAALSSALRRALRHQTCDVQLAT